MPVFYVILPGKGRATADADGLASAHLDAAIADCVQAAREHISEAAATGGRLGLDRRFEIFGLAGQLLYTVPFRHVILAEDEYEPASRCITGACTGMEVVEKPPRPAIWPCWARR